MAVLITAGLALGAGSDTSAVRGCVAKGGALRVMTSGRCRSGERSLTWNQLGPAGSRGGAGPAGEAGTAGAPGADGASGVAGAPGQDGSNGARGTFDWDSFGGMPCVRGQINGTVHIAYGSSGQVAFTCS